MGWVVVLAIVIGSGYLVVDRLSRAGPPIPDLPSLAGAESDVAKKIRRLHAELEKDPAPDRWLRYGRCLHIHGYLSDAAGVYREAVSLFENPFEPLYLAAVVAAETDLETAMAWLEKAGKHAGDYVPYYLFKGRVSFDLGHTAAAGEAYTRANDLEETSQGLLGLGRIALKSQDVAAAIDYLERARTRNPNHAAVHTALSRAYYRAGREEEAATAASRARSLPERTPIRDALLRKVAEEGVSYLSYESMALQLVRTQRYQAALPYIEKAIASRPGYRLPILVKGKALYALGRFGEAIRVLDECVRLESDREALYYRALSLRGAGRFADAAVDLHACLAIDPADTGAERELAVTHRDCGRPDLALAHARSVLRRVPSPEAHLLLATILEALGDRPGARKQVDHALTLDPAHVGAKTMREQFR